jgi:hypothetical protein
VLDRIPGGYRCSLDGNEQYDDIEGVLALWRRMHAEPRLARLCASVAFVEQPIKRQSALERDVSALSAETPVIVDESDDGIDAFLRARDKGYRGVSSKTCKGIYKSLRQRRPLRALEPRDARPLPDERRGPDDPGRHRPAAGPGAGLAARHPPRRAQRPSLRRRHGRPARRTSSSASSTPIGDLYERSHGAVRLKIRGGELAIGSLGGAGFASGAAPDWASMRRMKTP